MPAFTNGPAQFLDGWVAKILCAAVVATLSVASAPGGTVLAQDASTIAQKPPPGSAEARRREHRSTSRRPQGAENETRGRDRARHSHHRDA